MTVYHTPRCRIIWTNVVSDGVDRDVVNPLRPLTLYFGLEFDNNIRYQGGYFALRFTLITPYGGDARGTTWGGYTPTQFPGSGGNIWVSMSWAEAKNATGGATRSLWNYQPSVHFSIIPPGGGFTGDDEFAVAEQDHYIHFE